MREAIKYLQKEMARDKDLLSHFQKARETQGDDINPNYPMIIEAYERRITEFKQAIKVLNDHQNNLRDSQSDNFNNLDN
jgi:septal ring factor EnvC (AmiA/AmiB activator)